MGAESNQSEQRISVEEYLTRERKADRKSELWQGMVYPQRGGETSWNAPYDMAGGSSPHSRIASNLTIALGRRIDQRPCQTYTSDMKVLARATEFVAYPDVSMVCGEEQLADEHRDCLLNPCLIVEVLSSSTQKYDREKFFHYQQLPSLQYYLLIHQDRAWIELFGRLEGGAGWSYQIIGHPEDAEQGLAANLELTTLDLTLPLKEIYRRIPLEPFLPPTQ